MTYNDNNRKLCFVCGANKPRTEFYAHPQMAGGLLGKCKGCTKMHSTQRRNASLDQVREYDRDRRRGVVAPSHWKRPGSSEYKRAWSDRNKEKRAAHFAVRYAIMRGSLKKEPCQMCGCVDGVHGHHWDYLRPLDVVWLCARHHSDLHMAIRDAERFDC